MPFADVGGVKLFYEERGQGTPLIFVHEFAGDYQSWHPAGALLREALPHHRRQRARLPALRRAGQARRLLAGPGRRRLR